MQEYDEGRMNKKFPVYKYYQAIQICAMVLGEKLPNDKKLNTLYMLYNQARHKGDSQKIMRYISLLKVEMMKDKIYLDRFENKYRHINIEEETISGLYHPDGIGYLSYEEN